MKILFLHHSCGRNLIKEGNVRQLLKEYNLKHATRYELWDHDYNRIGETDKDGKRTGVCYHIPDDNTDPDGFANLFSQPVSASAENAMRRILKYDVIAFKSCYPASAIRSEAQLEEYYRHYRRIGKVVSQHSQKTVIVLTPPPLAPLRTNPANAKRARAFANWLKDEFADGYDNLFVFDFFSLLAAPESAKHHANMLQRAYRRWLPFDSHPNRKANEAIGPQFVDFIIAAIREHEVSRRKR